MLNNRREFAMCHLVVDSTIIRAHQHAEGAKKTGEDLKPPLGALVGPCNRPIYVSESAR